MITLNIYLIPPQLEMFTIKPCLRGTIKRAAEIY